MKRKTLPYHTQPQMFVFGEVQEPTQETVNLVEDIVRSQIIELVCHLIAIGFQDFISYLLPDPAGSGFGQSPRCSVFNS